jgi:hypothetical protein
MNGMDNFNSHRHGGGRRIGGQRWDEVDAALLVLIRLVLEDSWSERRAAAELRAKVPDESVLRGVRTCVARALAERPTPVAKRATRTLDIVFSDCADHDPGRALVAEGA